MSGINWTAVGAIGAAAGVLATLVALILQLRTLNKHIESATYQQIVRMFDDFSRMLIDRPDLVRSIYHSKKLGSRDQRLSDQTNWAIGIRFGWFESVVIQRSRYRILSKGLCNHWMKLLRMELESPALMEHWQKYSNYYQPELVTEVKEILARRQARRAARVTPLLLLLGSMILIRRRVGPHG